MADIGAEAEVFGGNCRLFWTLHFDDSANTVTIEATHSSKVDGSPVPDPQQAEITVVLNSSVDITVDLLTGRFVAPSPANLIGRDFSQASPGEILNAGAKTRTGVRVRVSADRAAALTFTTQYTPPAP